MRRVLNLTAETSNFKYVNYLSGTTIDRMLIQSELSKTGYCLLRDTNYHQNLMNDSSSETSIHILRKSIYGDNYKDQLMNYTSGTDDRTVFRNSFLNVSVTSSDLFIPFHNELCYAEPFPRVLSFICIKPSLKGGQTPISNCISTWNDLNSDSKKKFKEYGVRYIRNLRSEELDGEDIHDPDKKTWQKMFETDDKSQVERLCKDEYDYDFEWRDNDVLRICYRKPAFVEFDDGVVSFANGITGLHGSYFDTGYDNHYENVEFKDRPHHCLWGNGDEFSNEEIDDIYGSFNGSAVSFDWKEGDILVIDNMKWAHSRNPYQGERLMLALIGIPSDYSQQAMHDPFYNQQMG